jgi:hypothetical protein
MRALRQLVRMVRRRMRLERWLWMLVPSLHVAAGGAVAALILMRLAGMDGWRGALVAGFACGAIAWIVLARRRPVPDDASVAIEIDARLGLEGRIATALALEGRPDPFEQAALEDGARAATDPALRRRASDEFRPALPAMAAWVPVAWIVFAMLAWMAPVRVPQAATPGAGSDAQSAQVLDARAAEAEARVQEAVQILSQNPQAQQRLQDLLATLAPPPPAAPASEGDGVDAAERRESEALQRASRLEDRLGRELESPDLAASDALQDALATLPQIPGLDPALLEALKTGRLEAAAEKLEQLARDAAGSDPAKAEQARKALEALAQAIEQANDEASKALASELQKAGMDPKLAQDPVAAQKAIEQAQKSGKLTPQQAQALKDKAASQQQSKRDKQALSQSIRECRDGSSASARRELSRQQSAQRMQAALQMAMQQCNNPSGAGWSMPWTRSKSSAGGGTGGASGKGGGKPGQQGMPNTRGRTEAIPDGKLAENQESAGDGNALDDAAARDFVRAEGLPAGTSSRQMQAVASKVAAGLEQATEEDPVPARLKEAHKRYFEQWKRQLESKGTGGAPPAP